MLKERNSAQKRRHTVTETDSPSRERSSNSEVYEQEQKRYKHQENNGKLTTRASFKTHL